MSRAPDIDRREARAGAVSGRSPAEIAREEEDLEMNVERWLRLIAGLFVLASTVLGVYVSPYFHLFTAFVALNLIQSAFTNWCPMMTFLRKAGVRDA